MRIKRYNRREAIAFFRAAGDEDIALLLEAAESTKDTERRSRTNTDLQNYKDRTGQLVQPNARWAYRPVCMIEKSEYRDYHVHNALGSPKECTLHTVRYPNGVGECVWECEFGYKFNFLPEVAVKTTATD